MRRTARILAIMTILGSLTGCRSIHAPWARTETPEEPAHPLNEAPVRTARDAVPDSVMLRDQARGGYSESPAGQ